jgi:hypothetical protein
MNSQNTGSITQVTIDRQGQGHRPNLNGERIDRRESYRLTPEWFWSSLLELVEKNGRGSTAFVIYEGRDPLLIATRQNDLEAVSAEVLGLLSEYRGSLERAREELPKMLEVERATMVEALIAKHGPRFDESANRETKVTSRHYVRGGTQSNPDEGYFTYTFETPQEAEVRVVAERKAFALTEGAAELAALESSYRAKLVDAGQTALATLHKGLTSLQRGLM